jgi:phage-related protein (TIGR01555 family)
VAKLAASQLTLKPRVTLDEFRRVNDASVREQRRMLDAFSNPSARLGYGTPNMTEGAQYPLTRLTRNYLLLVSLYRSNWIVRKVIDTKAEDMLKNGWRINSQVTPAQIDKYEQVMTATGTVPKLIEALSWSRLYGGAGALIVIEGEEDLEKPLKAEDIELDSYRGLLVFDRWSGISPGAKLNQDINDPLSFGLPDFYQLTIESGTRNVHHSRILRFTGRKLPRWELQAEQYWGVSEVEIMFEELKKRDNTSWNIASLVFRANILGLRQKDLSQMLSGIGTNAAAAQRFYQTLQAQSELISNQGIMVLPEEGGLETHPYGFGGISDVYQNFMLDICGATEYTMTRLFGRTISGLGQSNEGDEHQYYDHVSQLQRQQLDPILRHQLLPIIAVSTWGKVPKDFNWSFNPVRSMSAEDQAELGAKSTDAVDKVFNSGIIGRKTALQELQQQSDITGLFSNITDEMVADADEEPMGQGELLDKEAGLERDNAEHGSELDKDKAEHGSKLEKEKAEHAAKLEPKPKPKAKDANPFNDEFGSPREHVAKLMEYRSFNTEARGNNWVEYSRGDHRYGKYQRTAWKDVPDEARGRWCRVYFADDDKVSKVEMHWDGKARTQKGFEGVQGFASSAGDADASQKMTKKEVQYENVAKGADHCGACTHFEDGGTCAIVSGSITYKGWCEEFKAPTEDGLLSTIAEGYQAGRKLAGAEDAGVESTNLEYEDLDFQGLKVNIENLRGSTRHGAGWHQQMTAPYGYIQNTEGADGDAVDCFVGPVLNAPYAYVVHTKNPKTGAYDEDKVMLGYESAKEAHTAFLENYSSPDFFESMEKISVRELKLKLRTLRGRKLTNGQPETAKDNSMRGVR